MKNIMDDIKEDPNSDYTLVSEPSKKEKEFIWKNAIGLQSVDGLKPTPYLLELSNASIEDKLTYNQIEERLNQYYNKKKKTIETKKLIKSLLE